MHFGLCRDRRWQLTLITAMRWLHRYSPTNRPAVTMRMAEIQRELSEKVSHFPNLYKKRGGAFAISLLNIVFR